MVVTRKQYQDEVKEFWSKKCERLRIKNDELKNDLDLHDTIVATYKAETKHLKGLLGVVICPNATNGCKNGILINPNGEPEPCQWCGMTKQALKENNETL